MENENSKSLNWEDADVTVHHVEETVKDWSNYSPFMLKQPIHRALVVSKECTPARSNNLTEKPNEASSSEVETAELNKSAGKVNPFKAGRKRPSLKAFQENKRSASGEKYTALAETKKMLAERQINLIERELAIKNERHEKEMELLNLQIEAEKMNLKNKQLQFSQMK